MRNEYAHDLSKTELFKIVSEITGSPHDNGTVKAIVYTFQNAKDFADFNSKQKLSPSIEREIVNEEEKPSSQNHLKQHNMNLGLNYTINLVLPKTDDPAIFNAIFKSLKENLLNG